MKMRLAAYLTTFLLISILCPTFLFAGPLDGTVNGGTMTDTATGKRIDGPGNVEFVGDWSTPAGFTVDIYALNALLRANTGVPTIANGIYTLYGPGTLGMINTAGIVFGSTAQVNAANVIISTLNIDSNNFFNPTSEGYKFYKDGNSAYIINAGRIAARPGGYIVLLSQAIDNSGTIAVSSIDAAIGKIVLAVGEKMTVALDDKGLISVAVDDSLRDTLPIIGPDGNPIGSAIKNSGKILTEGGKVTLTAKVLNNIFNYAINNTGIIEASSLVKRNGTLELVADGPAVANRGNLNADNLNLYGSSPVYFYGDTDFYNFSCSVPSKELYFEAGKTYIFYGHTYIQGTPGYVGLTKLSSNIEGTPWYSYFYNTQHISYVALKDAYNLSDTVKAESSTKWSYCQNWDTDPAWDGGGSTNNWSEAANWDTDTVPTPSDDIAFNGASTKDSVVNQDFTVNSLAINTGYTGTISINSGIKLTVNNTGTGHSVTITGGNFGTYLAALVAKTGDNFGTYTFNPATDAAPGADSNDDGRVDAGDLRILAADYDKSGDDLPGDMNHDGRVDVTDLGILATNYDRNRGSGVKFNNNREADIVSWSNDRIICAIPNGAKTGNVSIWTTGGKSATTSYFYEGGKVVLTANKTVDDLIIDRAATAAAVAGQISTLNNIPAPIPTLQELSQRQINTFSPSNNVVYFYQPLTPYDMAAFDALMVSANDYEFLKGKLSLVGHAGLLPMFEEELKR